MIFTNSEDQYWATRANWTDMADIIKTKWDEGYVITDATYGDNIYFVLMEKGTGSVGQEYLWNKSLTKTLEEISEGSGTRFITSVFCGDSSSCLVRTELDYSIEQRWCQSAIFPKKDIEYYWNMGYVITAMNWCNGYWTIIFSKGIPYARMESWETIFKPKLYNISKKFHQEARIVSSLCFGDGKWALSYARHPKIFDQKIYMDKEFPDEKITELWNENYDLSKVAYGRGQWFLTFISSSESAFNRHERFRELYRARKFGKALEFFNDHLYDSVQSPEPILLDFLQCFRRLKKYEAGIAAFEHFNTLFGTYHEAMHLGADFYYLAYKQNQSEAYLRKALKCYSQLGTATPDIQKKMGELRSLLPDDQASDIQWKQKIALEEQERRKTDRESKHKKF